MTVDVVREGDADLPFAHRGDRLLVRLGRPAHAGERRTFTVVYHGTPADGLIVGANRHGERTFFGDNWPNRARHWLPTVDHPSDKARVTWEITAADGYQVIANGRLVEETEVPAGRRTRYVSDHPLPTKVMVFGAAPFAVEHRGVVAGVPVESWAYAPDREAGFADLALGDRVLRVLAERLGPFPYEKLAHVQSTTRYGGMENAGAIFYDEGAVTGTGTMEGLIAHETAHQWFGDAVTETDWPHLWLSEGFATYLAHVYAEAAHGRDRMAAGLARDRARILAFAEANPALPVLDTLTADPNDLLNANSYQKGSWVLHMLRRRVGDAAFFDGLRTQYARYRDGNVTTDDFRRTMEEVAGQDLRGFFDQWLRRGGVPHVEATWRAGAGGVTLDVRQTHEGAPYAFPLDVALVAADGTRRTVTVEVSARGHTFTLPTDVAPAAVVLDPDTGLLARLTLTGPDGR
jgi:aminopeptidase N